MRKTGLIVEGGGMKCAYSAGVLDYFLDFNINFDYCIGVSAGAANIASYLAKQRERNLRYYTIHAQDPRYVGIRNLIKTGSVFGLQYIYGELSNSTGDDPIDYNQIIKNPSEFYFPATDALTGRVDYLSKKDLSPDDYRGFMATSAMPAFCKPVKLHGHLYYDGGVGDSIPVQKALDDGCEKLIIVLERPRGFIKQPENFRPIYKRMLHKYPETIKAVDNRHVNYRSSMQLAYQLESDGKAIIIAPSRQVKITTFTKDPVIMRELYHLGMEDTKKLSDDIISFLNTYPSSKEKRA